MEVPTEPGRKTHIWRVDALEDGATLGTVKWFGRWRTYAFFPEAQTVFEKKCLRDIADFCERQTTLHRETKRQQAMSKCAPP